jgi:hypothetical protein
VRRHNAFPYRCARTAGERLGLHLQPRQRRRDHLSRWHPVGVIEYGYVAPDPLHPETVYGAGRSEVSKFDMVHRAGAEMSRPSRRDPAYRADRTEPILFSPLDPHDLFYAANVLFETKDYGKNMAEDQSRSERASTPASPHRWPLPEKDTDRVAA